MLAATLLAAGLKVGAQMVIARLTPLSEIAEAQLISTWTNAVSVLVLPLVLVMLMVALQRREREAGGLENV